jgi:dsDNA-binding SOS-regulon protein
MLTIAERLYAVLQAAELNMGEDTLEALSVYMAQHREPIGTLLKGGKLKTPDGRVSHTALPQDERAEAAAPAPKGSQASPGAPTTKPKAAA